MNRLLEYLPKDYHDIIEIVELAETEEIELVDVEQAVGQLFKDQFVMTSSEAGVKRREKLLRIQADPSTESLNFRRKRIMNRYSTKPPFTKRYLQEQLDRLVGRGMTIVTIDSENFMLFVTANIEDANVFKEVLRTVETVKPANLTYQQNTALKSDIGLVERIVKQDMSWNYVLDGSWKLGEKPFVTFEAEEVIK